jgi:hypothetical protein
VEAQPHMAPRCPHRDLMHRLSALQPASWLAPPPARAHKPDSHLARAAPAQGTSSRSRTAGRGCWRCARPPTPARRGARPPRTAGATSPARASSCPPCAACKVGGGRALRASAALRLVSSPADGRPPAPAASASARGAQCPARSAASSWPPGTAGAATCWTPGTWAGRPPRRRAAATGATWRALRRRSSRPGRRRRC